MADPISPQPETKMPSLWKSYWQVLFLSPQPFHNLKGSRGNMWFGVRFFLLIMLVASLGKLFAAVDIVQQPTLAERVSGVAVRIETYATGLPRILARPVQEVAERVEALAEGVREVQPPLGVRASKLLRLAGEWLNVPLTLLGAWMGWALGIWVVARALGAAGALRDHLSLALLSAAPQVLVFASFLPFEGANLDNIRGILALIALVWSLMILAQALTVAHDVSQRVAAMYLAVSALTFLVIIPFLCLLPVWLALAVLL